MSNKELIKTLMLTASTLFSGISVVLLLICLISDSEGLWVLPTAIGCSVLSSVFSLIRSTIEMKEEKAKKDK